MSALQRFSDRYADELARACQALALRFDAGGKLLALGENACAGDGPHVAVEFLHPVLPGKRALPALAVTRDDLPALAEPCDALLSLDADITSDLFHIAIGARERPADFSFAVESDDPWVVEEVCETAYHVLWELVHLFLQHGDSLPSDAGPGAFLYPFLGAPTESDLMQEAAHSTRLKFAEGIALREQLALEQPASALLNALAGGARIFTAGNGGSATDASDFARLARARGISAVALNDDWATVTALANDVGVETVFARPLQALARRGDVLVLFSTSGNSRNLVRTLETARQLEMPVIALTGSDGGDLKEQAPENLIWVRSLNIPRIQEAHAAAYHGLLSRCAAAGLPPSRRGSSSLQSSS